MQHSENSRTTTPTNTTNAASGPETEGNGSTSSQRSKWLAWGLLLVAALLAAGLGFSWRKQQYTAAPVSQHILWQQTLPDAFGKPQALKQWQGKILVVNFWATWCPPCKAEMPDLASVQQLYRAQEVQFVGLAVDTAQNVEAFARTSRWAEQRGYPLLVASQVGLELAHQFGNRAGGLPYTVVLDTSGRIRYQKAGQITPAELTGWLNSLLLTQPNTALAEPIGKLPS